VIASLLCHLLSRAAAVAAAAAAAAVAAVVAAACHSPTKTTVMTWTATARIVQYRPKPMYPVCFADFGDAQENCDDFGPCGRAAGACGDCLRHNCCCCCCNCFDQTYPTEESRRCSSSAGPDRGDRSHLKGYRQTGIIIVALGIW